MRANRADYRYVEENMQRTTLLEVEVLDANNRFFSDWMMDLHSSEGASPGARSAQLWEAIRADYAGALTRKN